MKEGASGLQELRNWNDAVDVVQGMRVPRERADGIARKVLDWYCDAGLQL